MLHRSIFGCVEQIAHGIKTDLYVVLVIFQLLLYFSCIQFIQKYIRIFFHYKCEVTLVFDGNALPAKKVSYIKRVLYNLIFKEINESRKVRRESNQKLSSELISAGKNSEAYKVMRQGIGVPRDITLAAIEVVYIHLIKKLCPNF